MFTVNKEKLNFTVDNFKSAKDYLVQLNSNYEDLIKEYESMTLTVDLAGVKHKLKFGGIHGAIPNYIGHGTLISLDVTSYYPYLMVITTG